MELTKNRAVLDWIDQQVKLTQPDQVIWIDGSEQQLEALLGKYVPGAEALRTKLRKYDAAYKALTAENAAMEKQLGATSKESVLKKLEISEKLRELDELHRMVDGIPPEILQAAKQVAAHKQQER